MAGPGTQIAPKERSRITLDTMRNALHSMALLLLESAGRILLTDEVRSSHLDVVQNALAGVVTEASDGETQGPSTASTIPQERTADRLDWRRR